MDAVLPPTPAKADRPRWFTSAVRPLPVDGWRARLLRVVVRGAAALGAVVYVPSVVLAFRDGLPLVVIADTLAVGLVVALALTTRGSHALRSWIFMGVTFVIAVALLIEVGTIAYAYLIAGAMLGVLLLGPREGSLASVLGTLAVLMVGLAGHGLPPAPHAEGLPIAAQAAVVALNYGFVTGLLVAGTSVVIETLEHARSQAVVAAEERAAAEAQLREAQKMDALGRLAGGVAHDINNMMGVVIGHADLARESVDDPEGREALRDDLDAVLAAAERCADLCRQLLAFARRQAVERRPVLVDDAVDSTLRLLQGTRSDVHVEREGHADGAVIIIDPAQLDQIVLNLVSNALQASVAGGVVRVGTAVRGSEPGPQSVHLVVEDHGVGMTEDVLARAFEPFFTTRADGEGTGLGLATVHGIVHQYGGRIEIASTVGAGTRVEVELPLVRAASGPARALRERLQERGAASVLVVDDEPALLALMDRLLSQAGFAVEAHAHPQSALDALDARETPWVLVVTDVRMPGLTGPELLARIDERWPDTPAIIVTGDVADALPEHLPAHVRVVEKPNLSRALVETVLAMTETPGA